MILRDAWLLATGTLTAVRVPPPGRVDRSVAGLAMALAPVAAVPLGVAAALVVLLGNVVGLPPQLLLLRPRTSDDPLEFGVIGQTRGGSKN